MLESKKWNVSFINYVKKIAKNFLQIYCFSFGPK